MTYDATPVIRGCGTRKEGGIYGECGLSPYGLPLEAFLIDPPIVVDRENLGLHPIGVTLLEDPTSGVTHVVDWVGEESYSHVADFLEEARRFGVSRRLPRTLDSSRLTSGSRLVLLHRRAIIGNPAPYFAARDGLRWEQGCPAQRPDHRDPAQPPGMCAGLWWEDLTAGGPVPQEGTGSDPRLVTRTMPSFTYQVRLRPAGVEPDYHLAMFASFPLSRIVVIRDPEGGTHEAAMDVAARAQLPVEAEDV